MRYNQRMNRYARILIAVLALLLVVAGSALATKGGKSAEHRSPMAASHQPESNDAEKTDTDTESAEGAPSDKLLGRLVDRLADAGIDSDAETLAALAADYGVGGAVRLVTWADASGMDASELAAMFDSGLGWGEIAHQLMEDDPLLDLSPGIGWVIGKGHANGHGQATAEAHRP